jgi:hypothetical protein
MAAPAFPPALRPRRKLGWSDLVAGEVAFMQAETIVLGHFPETLALIGRDILFGPSSQKGRRLTIETIAHDWRLDLGTIWPPEQEIPVQELF